MPRRPDKKVLEVAFSAADFALITQATTHAGARWPASWARQALVSAARHQLGKVAIRRAAQTIAIHAARDAILAEAAARPGEAVDPPDTPIKDGPAPARIIDPATDPTMARIAEADIRARGDLFSATDR